MSNTQHHEALVRSIEQLADALEVAIETLTEDRALALAAIEELRATESISTIAVNSDMAAIRERFTAAITQLESARGHARAEMFQALQREGYSIGQIARLWGISRQLASRIMRDHPDTHSA